MASRILLPARRSTAKMHLNILILTRSLILTLDTKCGCVWNYIATATAHRTPLLFRPSGPERRCASWEEAWGREGREETRRSRTRTFARIIIVNMSSTPAFRNGFQLLYIVTHRYIISQSYIVPFVAEEKYTPAYQTAVYLRRHLRGIPGIRHSCI